MLVGGEGVDEEADGQDKTRGGVVSPWWGRLLQSGLGYQHPPGGKRKETRALTELFYKVKPAGGQILNISWWGTGGSFVLRSAFSQNTQSYKYRHSAQLL